MLTARSRLLPEFFLSGLMAAYAGLMRALQCSVWDDLGNETLEPTTHSARRAD